MYRPRTTLVLGLAAFAVACSDAGAPTAPVASTQVASAAKITPAALTNPLASIPIVTAVGGTLLGHLTITSLSVVNGVLVAAGSFTAVGTGIVTTFTNLPVSLIGSGPGASCQILTLHIGAIDLDLLGLVVELAPVDLDIHADPGPGKLLGNLLCAVTHLLDGGGALAGLTNLLNQINAILAALSL